MDARFNQRHTDELFAPPVQVIDVGRVMLDAVYWGLDVECDEEDSMSLHASFKHDDVDVTLIINGQYWTARTWTLPDGSKVGDGDIPKDNYDEITLDDKTPTEAWPEFRFSAEAKVRKAGEEIDDQVDDYDYDE